MDIIPVLFCSLIFIVKCWKKYSTMTCSGSQVAKHPPFYSLVKVWHNFNLLLLSYNVRWPILSME